MYNRSCKQQGISKFEIHKKKKKQRRKIYLFAKIMFTLKFPCLVSGIVSNKYEDNNATNLGLVMLADSKRAKNKKLMDDNLQRCLLASCRFLSIADAIFRGRFLHHSC